MKDVLHQFAVLAGHDHQGQRPEPIHIKGELFHGLAVITIDGSRAWIQANQFTPLALHRFEETFRQLLLIGRPIGDQHEFASVLLQQGLHQHIDFKAAGCGHRPEPV